MSATVRRLHRWVSAGFTLAVIANFVALGLKAQATWIGLLALVPLFVLLFSGVYLFALPYFGRARRPDDPG